jgi:hypothetical protein
MSSTAPLVTTVGVVQHHAVDDTPAPIVPGDHELLVTKAGHHFDPVLGHGPKGYWLRGL